MILRAGVYYNDMLAGVLARSAAGTYSFTYDDAYLAQADLPSISLSMPKREREYQADQLFPFFRGLLSAGENRAMQEYMLNIKDDFLLLIKTAGVDTIGAVTIRNYDAMPGML